MSQLKAYPSHCSSFQAVQVLPLIAILKYMLECSRFRFLKGCWTDEEVKVATGNADCHVVVHPLKLKSSYATVKVLGLFSLTL